MFFVSPNSTHACSVLRPLLPGSAYAITRRLIVKPQKQSPVRVPQCSKISIPARKSQERQAHTFPKYHRGISFPVNSARPTRSDPAGTNQTSRKAHQARQSRDPAPGADAPIAARESFPTRLEPLRVVEEKWDSRRHLEE